MVVEENIKKPVRKALDVRKASFTYMMEHDDFLMEDLFEKMEIQEKEKVHVYSFLREMSYFGFLQGIKQGNSTRYIKVNAK